MPRRSWLKSQLSSITRSICPSHPHAAASKNEGARLEPIYVGSQLSSQLPVCAGSMDPRACPLATFYRGSERGRQEPEQVGAILKAISPNTGSMMLPPTHCCLYQTVVGRGDQKRLLTSHRSASVTDRGFFFAAAPDCGGSELPMAAVTSHGCH